MRHSTTNYSYRKNRNGVFVGCWSSINNNKYNFTIINKLLDCLLPVPGAIWTTTLVVLEADFWDTSRKWRKTGSTRLPYTGICLKLQMTCQNPVTDCATHIKIENRICKCSSSKANTDDRHKQYNIITSNLFDSWHTDMLLLTLRMTFITACLCSESSYVSAMYCEIVQIHVTY